MNKLNDQLSEKIKVDGHLPMFIKTCELVEYEPKRISIIVSAGNHPKHHPALPLAKPIYIEV